MIADFKQLTEKIFTSGRVDEDGFKDLQKMHIKTVINLAPYHAINAFENEKEVVDRLGFEYIHIPSEFTQPKMEEYFQFEKVFQELLKTDKKVLVHCIANKRVSSFFYIYFLRNGGDIFNYIDEMWTPDEIWKKFINSFKE